MSRTGRRAAALPASPSSLGAPPELHRARVAARRVLDRNRNRAVRAVAVTFHDLDGRAVDASIDGDVREVTLFGERGIVGEQDIAPGGHVAARLPVGIELAALEKTQMADGVNGPVAALDVEAAVLGQLALVDDRVEDLGAAGLALAPHAEMAGHRLAHENTRFRIRRDREPDGGSGVRLGRDQHLALVDLAQ